MQEQRVFPVFRDKMDDDTASQRDEDKDGTIKATVYAGSEGDTVVRDIVG